MDRPRSPTITPLSPRCVATESFAPLLRGLGVSLVVAIRGANGLIVIRDDGASVDLRFTPFDRPTALAHEGGRLAIGTALELLEYQEVAGAGQRFGADSCFLPRRAHV